MFLKDKGLYLVSFATFLYLIGMDTGINAFKVGAVAATLCSFFIFISGTGNSAKKKEG
jgi:hypothetical protein